MLANTRVSGSWLNTLAIVAASSPVWIVLAVLAWPHLRDILDGRDTLLPDEKYPNYVRNLFELTSFIATTAVLITALWAFNFTRSQIEEARVTRLATLYAALETRWSSAEMLKSKEEFANISIGYELARQGGATQPLADYAAAYVSDLQRADYARFSTLMSLIEYLEYIGMLEKSGYLNIDDIQYILGTVCIEVYAVMSKYISNLREAEARRRVRNRLTRAPAEFQCFLDLERKFSDKFAT